MDSIRDGTEGRRAIVDDDRRHGWLARMLCRWLGIPFLEKSCRFALEKIDHEIADRQRENGIRNELLGKMTAERKQGDADLSAVLSRFEICLHCKVVFQVNTGTLAVDSTDGNKGELCGRCKHRIGGGRYITQEATLQKAMDRGRRQQLATRP